ncbi:Leucine-rich_repeat [Hexamita inflata]|uniref:Leucine-rich repeat n=1 Tax=Hexamita inflata TaxID=28002 RepID=A0AA86NNR0_9EUKA|nr:Leucine-rich repeat [Hexamita inflata]
MKQLAELNLNSNKVKDLAEIQHLPYLDEFTSTDQQQPTELELKVGKSIQIIDQTTTFLREIREMREILKSRSYRRKYNVNKLQNRDDYSLFIKSVLQLFQSFSSSDLNLIMSFTIGDLGLKFRHMSVFNLFFRYIYKVFSSFQQKFISTSAIHIKNIVVTIFQRQFDGLIIQYLK